jgi:hypothetical protein
MPPMLKKTITALTCHLIILAFSIFGEIGVFQNIVFLLLSVEICFNNTRNFRLMCCSFHPSHESGRETRVHIQTKLSGKPTDIQRQVQSCLIHEAFSALIHYSLLQVSPQDCWWSHYLIRTLCTCSKETQLSFLKTECL